MIRVGIIGAGNIAHRFAKALQYEKDAELYAISGRNEEKLKAFAEEFPCEKQYIGHENLLHDENVDCVYIALPHRMHAEWIIKAANAHKHVMVEKPAVMSSEEAVLVKDAVERNDVIFMEGMKNRFTDAYQNALQAIVNGEIGKIKRIETHHGFALPKEMYGKSYHTSGVDAGCLYDIGCYGIGFILDFVKGLPIVEKTYTNMYQNAEIYLDTFLQFENVEVELECAFDRNLEAKAVIHGTNGDMEVAPLHRPDHYVIQRNGKEERYDFPFMYDDFYDEVHAFVQCVKNGKSSHVMPVENTVRESQISDLIRASFTKYDESDLKVLEEQERCFCVEEVTSQDALQIGMNIISFLPEYDRGISVQIIRESDECTVFQYITDDKKESNLMYASGKRNAILAYGHSSAYVNVYRKLHDIDEELKEKKVLPSGGAFPLYNKEGKLVASVLVSGLHEGKDHELIVRGLEKTYGVKAPVFVKALG